MDLASRVALVVKSASANAADLETWARFLGGEDPLEEGTATHSSILVWRIPTDRGLVRELFGCESPRGLWVGFLLTVFPLMPLDSLTCPFADLLSPPKHGGPTSVILVLLERNRIL